MGRKAQGECDDGQSRVRKPTAWKNRGSGDEQVRSPVGAARRVDDTGGLVAAHARRSRMMVCVGVDRRWDDFYSPQAGHARFAHHEPLQPLEATLILGVPPPSQLRSRIAEVI